MGGKPLLRIEALLKYNRVESNNAPFLISHLKVVLHFLLQRNPVLPCACRSFLHERCDSEAEIQSCLSSSAKPWVTHDSSFPEEVLGLIEQKLFCEFSWAAAGDVSFTVTLSDSCIYFLFFQILKIYHPQSRKNYLMKYLTEMFRKVNALRTAGITPGFSLENVSLTKNKLHVSLCMWFCPWTCFK